MAIFQKKGETILWQATNYAGTVEVFQSAKTKQFHLRYRYRGNILMTSEGVHRKRSLTKTLNRVCSINQSHINIVNDYNKWLKQK